SELQEDNSGTSLTSPAFVNHKPSITPSEEADESSSEFLVVRLLRYESLPACQVPPMLQVRVRLPGTSATTTSMLPDGQSNQQQQHSPTPREDLAAGCEEVGEATVITIDPHFDEILSSRVPKEDKMPVGLIRKASATLRPPMTSCALPVDEINPKLLISSSRKGFPIPKIYQQFRRETLVPVGHTNDATIDPIERVLRVASGDPYEEETFGGSFLTGLQGSPTDRPGQKLRPAGSLSGARQITHEDLTPTHRLLIHDVKLRWNEANRDLVYTMMDTYQHARALKRNLSSQAIRTINLQPVNGAGVGTSGEVGVGGGHFGGGTLFNSPNAGPATFNSSAGLVPASAGATAVMGQVGLDSPNETASSGRAICTAIQSQEAGFSSDPMQLVSVASEKSVSLGASSSPLGLPMLPESPIDTASLSPKAPPAQQQRPLSELSSFRYIPTINSIPMLAQLLEEVDTAKFYAYCEEVQTNVLNFNHSSRLYQNELFQDSSAISIHTTCLFLTLLSQLDCCYCQSMATGGVVAKLLHA
ncbi:unnamed protein product, partial [Protopolystoma xenopodis]